MLSKFVASLVGMAFAFSAAPLQAKGSIAEATLDDLVVHDGQGACQKLGELLRNRRKQGEQWLIGDSLQLYNRAVNKEPDRVLGRKFTMVQCYGAHGDRVFIAEEKFEFCGWVDRHVLLNEHHRNNFRGTDVVQEQEACQKPRAMRLSQLCRKAQKGLLASRYSKICEGIPRGLRAKGVLTGGPQTQHSFFATSDRQMPRISKPFFSVLEIYDIETVNIDGDERAMFLVGDGDRQIFGWIDAEALRLWPTRLGLFFDEEGRGGIFRDRQLAIKHFQEGKPAPDVRSQGSKVVRQHVHGSNPLVSYPITRTLEEQDLKLHEIVFLGQYDGPTADLIQQAQISRSIKNVHEINIMVVMDTTESMLKYLATVTNGVAEFIQGFGVDSKNRGDQYPKVRLAVYAYSDFKSAELTGIGDPIKIEELMPPVAVGSTFDVSSQLAAIIDHEGLSDDAGQFREASLEAVIALAGRFEKDENWFLRGPRFIIHIADHGSRDGLDLSAIRRNLDELDVLYFPIIVTTNDISDDSGDSEGKQWLRKEARDAARAQAFELLKPNLRDPKLSVLSEIDFSESTKVRTDVVKDALQTILNEILQIKGGLRTKVLGEIPGAPNPTPALDSASARITFDEKLIRQYELDNIEKKVIAVAGKAFAPLKVKERGDVTKVDWVYTVALEQSQVTALWELHRGLCELVGYPDKVKEMRALVRSLLWAFSGDKMEGNDDVGAIFPDLGRLKGVNGGILSDPERQLFEKISSTDPKIVEELRKDVCWTSYHLGNVQSNTYAKRDDVVWLGSNFGVQTEEGVEVTYRIYKYSPIVGPELFYLPAWFFVVPPHRSVPSGSSKPSWFN